MEKELEPTLDSLTHEAVLRAGQVERYAGLVDNYIELGDYESATYYTAQLLEELNEVTTNLYQINELIPVKK